jgi:hypothetical protein
MAERVRHVEGDMFEADLGGPHDGALLFNIIHHLTPEQSRRLFGRVAGALHPGAPVCVLDLYDRPAGRAPDRGAYMGLFFHLTSSADTYSQGEVSGWLADTGFGRPKARRLPQLPGSRYCARSAPRKGNRPCPGLRTEVAAGCEAGGSVELSLQRRAGNRAFRPRTLVGSRAQD